MTLTYQFSVLVTNIKFIILGIWSISKISS